MEEFVLWVLCNKLNEKCWMWYVLGEVRVVCRNEYFVELILLDSFCIWIKIRLFELKNL